MTKVFVPKDIAGQRFGRLVATSFSHLKNRRSYWQCVCDCGSSKIVAATHLFTGNTKSCGCLCNEKRAARGRARIVPHRKHPEFELWRHIVLRCRDLKRKDYAIYGARGIDVCDRWAADFNAFLQDMGPRPSRDHSIDLIDNSKGYEPGNCRWATPTQQSRNRRSNITVDFRGEKRLLVELADEHGIPTSTARVRVKYLGWTVEQALNLEPRSKPEGRS